MKRENWGPVSALAIAMENDAIEALKARAQHLSIYLYGQGEIVLTWTCPTYVLRRRAMYSGRKGRAAIRRLRALGCGPLRPRTPYEAVIEASQRHGEDT